MKNEFKQKITMKKIAIILLLVLATNTMNFSQGCLPDGILFSMQESIDNFQTNFPGCTEIEGDVTICGSKITNLNGLDVITAFGGDLIINNCNLTSLSGLHNLTSIRGNFEIKWNSYLTSLTGLHNLTSINGHLNIQFNNEY